LPTRYPVQRKCTRTNRVGKTSKELCPQPLECVGLPGNSYRYSQAALLRKASKLPATSKHLLWLGSSYSPAHFPVLILSCLVKPLRLLGQRQDSLCLTEAFGCQVFRSQDEAAVQCSQENPRPDPPLPQDLFSAGTLIHWGCSCQMHPGHRLPCRNLPVQPVLSFQGRCPEQQSCCAWGRHSGPEISIGAQVKFLCQERTLHHTNTSLLITPPPGSWGSSWDIGL
jgi:hypothetical protein